MIDRSDMVASKDQENNGKDDAKKQTTSTDSAMEVIDSTTVSANSGNTNNGVSQQTENLCLTTFEVVNEVGF